ncbi:hypothetical protein D3C85_1838600 [compost metagenome]
MRVLLVLLAASARLDAVCAMPMTGEESERLRPLCLNRLCVLPCSVSAAPVMLIFLALTRRSPSSAQVLLPTWR